MKETTEHRAIELINDLASQPGSANPTSSWYLIVVSDLLFDAGRI
jgi:hypothetical protein